MANTRLNWRCLTPLVAALLAALPVVAAVAAADDDKDPQAAFDAVYGDAFRAALASIGKDDDVALAKQLAEAMRSFELPVPLIAVMADKACELADRAPAASLHADSALTFLASKSAPAAPAADAKAVTMLEKAHTAAARDADLKRAVGDRLLTRLVPLADRELKEKKIDQAITHLRLAQTLARESSDNASLESIRVKLEDAQDRQRRQMEIDQLEKKIEANPGDAEARKKLIRLHVVERDDPSSAAFFINDTVDETTRRLVPIAARDAAGAEVKALLDLGSWYMDLANDAATADASRPAMLKRSAGYFQRFLKDYQTNDLLKAKATLSLEQVNKKLGPAGTGTVATPTNPGTTPTTPAAGAGDLTIKIDGPAITEPDKVESLFQQFWRGVAKNYIAYGSEHAPFAGYNPRYFSSKGVTTMEAREKMTTTKTERSFTTGVVRKITVVPQPGEVDAVAMALPSMDVGQYGYIHSADVVEIVGPEEMIVDKIWLVDSDSIANVNWEEKAERSKLATRQSDWAWSKAKVRIIGHPTAGLKPATRVGMTGAKGRPLQIAIIALDSKIKADFFARRNYVAVTIPRLLKNDMEEKQFLELLASRGLTKTDFVNIYLEARRGATKDFLDAAIKRIEARGGK